MANELPSLPPSSWSAIIGAVTVVILTKVPEWYGNYRSRTRKENAEIAIAEIADKADQRMGLLNEVNRLWERVDDQDKVIETLRTDRLAVIRVNDQLRMENKSLRILVSRLIAEVSALRKKLDLEPLDLKEYGLPTEVELN